MQSAPPPHGPTRRAPALRGGRAVGARALAHVAIALVAIVIGGCESRMAQRPQETAPTPTAPRTENQVPQEATLGERLGRLDAAMRTASPEELPGLRAEYDRLLAERNGEPGVVLTGDPSDTLETVASDPENPSMPGPIDTTGLRDRLAAGQSHRWGSEDSLEIEIVTPPSMTGPTATPRRDTRTLTTSETVIDTLDMPRPMPRPVATATPETATATREVEDPSRLFKGLRESELATVPGLKRPTRARPSSRDASRRATKGRTARRIERPQDDLAVTSKPRVVEPAPVARGADAINSRGLRQGMVAGIAAARAGRYADAVTKLAPSVKSGRASADARYYYALSLEKTGQTGRASDEYLRASKGSGALSHKAYLDYCRMLARNGDRTKARQLLTQFIRRHGDSTQAVAARRLLQTL